MVIAVVNERVVRDSLYELAPGDTAAYLDGGRETVFDLAASRGATSTCK